MAAISTAWLNFLGSSDYEERPTFGYPFYDQVSATQTGLISDDFGRAEFLRVPLFDFRSGLGVRLPIAGSWTQNPIVLLREIAPGSIFYLWRTFLPTFVMLWTLNKAVDVLCGRGRYAWRTHVVTVCALGHVGLFSRMTDWTVAAGFNSALTTLSFAILLYLIEVSKDEKSTSRWIPLVVVYSTIEIATAHPGWLFYAVLMISSVLIAGYGTLRPAIQLSPLQVTRRLLQISALVLLVVAVNGLVTFFDLKRAFGGVPSSALRQGMTGDRADGKIRILAGLSKGILPEWSERLASEFVFSAFAPLFWAGYSQFQSSTVLLYAANLFPRGWFALLTAPAILIAGHTVNRSHCSKKAITGVFIIPSLVMIAYTFLQEYDLLPAVLATSGTWILSGSLRIFLVLGLLSTFSGIRVGGFRALRVCSSVSVALSLMYSVVMLGLLNFPPANATQASPTSRADTPIGPSSLEVGRVVAPGARILAVSPSEDYSNQTLLFLELRNAGYQVVAPVFTKNRNVQPIAKRPATFGLFVPYTTALEESMSQNRGRVFDFLNIEAVFIAQGSSESDAEVQLGLHDADTEIASAGISYQTFLNSSYSTFYHASKGSGSSSTCNVLEDRCDSLVIANRGPTRSTPRFQLCKLKCVAKFDFEFPSSEDKNTILLPVGFDPAIKVNLEGSLRELPAEDVGGFLGVHVENKSSGTLVLNIKPDYLMLGRNLATYLNSLLLLSSLLFAIFRFGPHRAVLRTRARTSSESQEASFLNKQSPQTPNWPDFRSGSRK